MGPLLRGHPSHNEKCVLNRGVPVLGVIHNVDTKCLKVEVPLEMFAAMHSSLVEGRGSNRLVRTSHGQCPALPLFVHLSPDSRLFLPGSHPVLMKGTQNTSQSFGCATLRHFLCFETLACLFCQLMWHMCTHAT